MIIDVPPPVSCYITSLIKKQEAEDEDEGKGKRRRAKKKTDKRTDNELRQHPQQQ